MKVFPKRGNDRNYLIIAVTILLSLVSVIQIKAPSVHRTVKQQERNTTLPTSKSLVDVRPERCDNQTYSLHGPGPVKEMYSGGWAVRHLCSQPLDTLFFVYTARKNWKLRVHLRATLFEEAARTAFNWTGVFFVEEHDDPMVNLWTKLEVEAVGDVVMLPYSDTYVSITHKYVGGMRWVTENCPNVRTIIKIDDDIGVQPFELRRYLDEKLPPKNNSIHCAVWVNTDVNRNLSSTYHISEDDLAKDRYPLYCSGHYMIMTMDIMRKLYRVSKFTKGHTIDDAYVSGYLAMFASIGHENFSSSVTLDSGDKTLRLLKGELIFTHEYFVYENSVGRRVQWGLMLWWHLMDAPGTFSFSDRLADKLYRLDFIETRRALEEGWYLPHPDYSFSRRPRRLARVSAEKNRIINRSRIAAPL
ncbi:hypothetical protein HPB49_023514 [Dermacentor silvarum]|uniref:Uncharacterized protein n=1 Tax=Dermacentor silvarum TaxID=543639 RepID=A0ACB8CI49_DERSI|nr:acetylgalactosaminyl-O-glycosyl-glycoprotein beta-1,3-N-acetylglucosaminyltransferase-like [Dermacentor silvarum]KAH7942374.1 hypothetical protein HPB49_023514 [Dermacentor silvarum]